MQKSVVLFIVEGQTEETALETVLNRIFSSETVKFDIVRDDITAQQYTVPDEVVLAVNKRIDSYCNHIIKRKDIGKVIHLIDMDGAFIPESAVKFDPEHEKAWYTADGIYIYKPERIIMRNREKAKNISQLITRNKIKNTPYSAYYFSTNFDEIICGNANLMSDKEKANAAEDFDFKYGEDPDAFLDFLMKSDFSVLGTYGESWWHIKQKLHSLHRYTNFGICFQNEIT